MALSALALVVAMTLPFGDSSANASLGDERIAKERELAALVSEERMQERVRELVKTGTRMGGTSSGERAARLLEKSFRDAGLDVRVVEDREKWCHEETSFALVARRLGGDETTLKLEHAWPFGFSPSAHGKVELALDSKSGGACLVEHFARDQDASKCALWLVDGETTRDGSYPIAHDLKAGDSNSAPVFGISKREGETLRTWLASGAKVELEFSLESVIKKGKPRTVIARIPGANSKTAWKDDYLLFCAHGDSDSGGPGADDNASGEAVVVEVALAWSKAIAEKQCAPPPREVRFAIWGSEIFSTDDYVENRASEGQVLGVVNYDQAGFGSGADQLNVEPDDLPANVALVSSLLAVLGDHVGDAHFPAHWATNKSLGGTDSYVFSELANFREKLRPALTLFASAWGEPAEHPRTPKMKGESWRERELVSIDYDNYYHSAGDTPANTTDKEPWNMGWCARVGWFGAERWLELAK